MRPRSAPARTVRDATLRLVLALLVLGLAASPSHATSGVDERSVVASGAVVISTSTTPADLDRVPGVEVLPQRRGATHDTIRAEVTAAGAARLAARSDVVDVEPDVPVTIDAGDPAHADNWAAGVLDLSHAWSRTEGEGIVVAVLDTGVAVHPELTGRLLAGADVVTGTTDGRGDPHGHGTKSALTVAAGRNDGFGAIGVCPRCRILPIRVLGPDGAGSLGTITQGIHAALDGGADVINISASGLAKSSPSFLVSAVARATAAGVPVVASAGNDGSETKVFPAADSGVIGVAGSTRDDTRYAWSNHGAWVDVAAPGCYRVSGHVSFTTFGWYCGTSAAAPVVSGALALARAAGRPADVPALRAALTSTSAPVPFVAGGRLDVCPLMSGGLIAPTVTMHSPAADADLPENATVVVSLGDDCGLARIRATLGGTTVASRTLTGTTANRLALPLDTRSIASGRTTLAITAVDQHGRSGTVSVPVTHRSAASSTTLRFTDVSGTHAADIHRLAALEITKGCGGTRYCPGRAVTRAEMATFLVRAFDPKPVLSTAKRPRFTDIGGSHADNIRALAAAGITNGCGGGRYCPDRAVTRAEMASFIVRAAAPRAKLSGSSLPRFRDISGTHAEDIRTLAAAGITKGCAADRYCPGRAVTRAEMASFLVRTVAG